MVNLNDLNFEQISTFKDLQKIIKSNKFYSSLYFWVYEYECIEDDVYKYSDRYIKNRKLYKFGNIRNKDNKNNSEKRVFIKVYKDFVELNADFEYKSFKKTINDRNNSSSYTLEQKIIAILDHWTNYYYC